MKGIIFLTIALISTSTAFCTELIYQWKPYETYLFEAKTVDNIDFEMTGMMGGAMKMEFHTQTKFSLFIESVDDNGTATGLLFLQEFTVVDMAGNIMASLNDIPKSAIVSDVTVDRKGKFTFMKEIYMVMTETSNVLVSASASASSGSNGVSASGTAKVGDQELNVYAEFDPKTGSMKSGYSLKTVATTKVVKVKTNADDPIIDILPYKFLELLALPDGQVNVGDEVAMSVAMQKINFKVVSLLNGEAKLQTVLSEDKEGSLTSSSMAVKSPTNGMNMSMEMDMENMEGMDDLDTDMDAEMEEMQTEMDAMNMNMDMGMTGMPESEGTNSLTSMMPTTTGTINGNFNYNIGMFKTVDGTMTTTMNAMGMKMNARTALTMKLL